MRAIGDDRLVGAVGHLVDGLLLPPVLGGDGDGLLAALLLPLLDLHGLVLGGLLLNLADVGLHGLGRFAVGNVHLPKGNNQSVAIYLFIYGFSQVEISQFNQSIFYFNVCSHQGDITLLERNLAQVEYNTIQNMHIIRRWWQHKPDHSLLNEVKSPTHAVLSSSVI